MPCPLSRTTILAWLPSRASVRLIVPAASVASSALSTMWPSTRSTRSSCPRVTTRSSTWTTTVRPRAAAATRMRSSNAGSGTPAGTPAGVSPLRNCSIRRRILSSEFSTVVSMSSWNSALSLSRRAFCIISESWATMFFKSCTTKADILLKASNLRASSKASVACIRAKKLAACRLAVFSKSRTSQLTCNAAWGRSITTMPVSWSPTMSGTASQCCGLSASQSGGCAPS